MSIYYILQILIFYNVDITKPSLGDTSKVVNRVSSPPSEERSGGRFPTALTQAGNIIIILDKTSAGPGGGAKVRASQSYLLFRLLAATEPFIGKSDSHLAAFIIISITKNVFNMAETIFFVNQNCR